MKISSEHFRIMNRQVTKVLDIRRKEEKIAYSNLTELDKELPYQLVGVGCDFHQHPIDRPFGYPTYQWIQTYEGSGILRIDGNDIRVPVNHGMLLYPGEEHEYKETDERWYVHWVTFNGYHIERMLHKLGFEESGVYAISDPQLLESHMQKAYRLIKQGGPLSGMDGSVLIYQLLFDLHRGIISNGEMSHTDRNRRLKPVLDHINDNLEHVITVDELADIMGITPQHFCVLFKEVTGIRPVEFINSHRIRRAKDLLVSEPSLQVADVGRRVGFDNNSYFSTTFKKFEGISPRQYKDLH